MNFKKFSLVVVFFMLVGSTLAQARHLKLYTYGVLDKGQVGVTYTLDYIEGPGGNSNTINPMLHELEIEYGITDKWTQSFYIDYDYLDGLVNEITSLKTEFNYDFLNQGEGIVDFRLNIEYAKAINGYTNAFNDKNAADTIEFRPIFQKSYDTFSVVIGPIAMKDIAAPNDAELGDWSFAHASAVLMNVTNKIGFNLELYGFGLGTANSTHYFVPNIDYAIDDSMSVSIAPAFGLTDTSDDYTLRFSIVKIF